MDSLIFARDQTIKKSSNLKRSVIDLSNVGYDCSSWLAQKAGPSTRLKWQQIVRYDGHALAFTS